VHRLSAKQVEKAKDPGYYCDRGGLYLQASPTASKKLGLQIRPQQQVARDGSAEVVSARRLW